MFDQQVARTTATLLAMATCLTVNPSRTTAQIAHDGSVCSSGAEPLAGPHFIIPARPCQTFGTNLFHSFSEFNILAGESATFTGPSQITNVLARVTGNEASKIQGILRTAGMPNANLFLMNPNGVVFGPGAQLDVAGSFAVTTANEIVLAQGGKFAATIDPADSVLSTASPVAFGFLTESPAAIEAEPVHPDVLTVLEATPGKSLAFVGGNINITDSEIVAPDGRVNIVSVGSKGAVKLDISDQDGPIDFDEGMRQGTVSIDSFSVIDVGGSYGEGRLVIRANDLTLDNESVIIAVGGDRIDLNLTGNLLLQHGSLIDGGSLAIRAHDLSIDGSGTIDGLETGINAVLTGADNGGITLDGDLLLSNGSSILAKPSGREARESVLIDARNVSIENNAFITMFIDTNIDMGQLKITTGELKIINGGRIDLEAISGAVNVGEINIQADQISIKGHDDLGRGSTAIRTLVDADHSIDKIVIDANRLEVANGAQIITTGLRTDTGNIRIHADDILIDGQNNMIHSTGLLPQSPPGDKDNPTSNGNITIQGKSLRLIRKATISTTTDKKSQGGSITINVERLMIDNISAITSNSTGSGSQGTIFGNGGTVSITANQEILLSGQSKIATSASQSDAGNIDVRAGTTLDLFDSEITADSGIDGGNIMLAATQRVLLQDGSIIAEAQQNGGNIIIDPILVDLQGHSVISANAVNGAGGNITIVTEILRQSVASQITAKSQFGVSGDVDISSNLDIAGNLVTLPTSLLGATDLTLLPHCAVQFADNVSSFTVRSAAGTPIQPGGWTPSFQQSASRVNRD